MGRRKMLMRTASLRKSDKKRAHTHSSPAFYPPCAHPHFSLPHASLPCLPCVGFYTNVIYNCKVLPSLTNVKFTIGNKRLGGVSNTAVNLRLYTRNPLISNDFTSVNDAVGTCCRLVLVRGAPLLPACPRTPTPSTLRRPSAQHLLARKAAIQPPCFPPCADRSPCTSSHSPRPFYLPWGALLRLPSGYAHIACSVAYADGIPPYAGAFSPRFARFFLAYRSDVPRFARTLFFLFVFAFCF